MAMRSGGTLSPPESTLNILARLRKAPRNVQREVYEALHKTFGGAGDMSRV